jgi:hypothetical protein
VGLKTCRCVYGVEVAGNVSRMSTLKDAARVTDELVQLATRLHAELTEGDVEFERMVELADEIGERADALAAAFQDVGRALAERLEDGGRPRETPDG